MFVSGLPPTFTNDQLKKHFASRFHVTDAHVLPKRRIGFVGFKNPEMAKQAAGYFNKSYVKMSKISVEIARPVCHFLAFVPVAVFLPLCTLTDQGGLETDQIYSRSIPNLMLRRMQDLPRMRTTSNGSGMRTRSNRTPACRSIFQ